MIDIDLVYLWVDGSDPEWIGRRNAFIGRHTAQQGDCRGRYADNGELRYSLRSVEEYAPWVRRIYIVTDRQVPSWLDTTNPKIRIVDHKEILPPEALPCFNSVVLEHHLHLIPGLSEHFLYANDDTFINRSVSHSDFFGEDGLPIIRLNRRYMRKYYSLLKMNLMGMKRNIYSTTIHNAALLVEKRFGKYYSSRTHHNIDAYLKSNYRMARELFAKEIDATLCNHVRSTSDIQRNLYAYVALSTKCAHPSYVGKNTSLRFGIHRRSKYVYLEKYNPMLFCLNDSEYSTDDDRRYAIEYLSRRFPSKSHFEM